MTIQVAALPWQNQPNTFGPTARIVMNVVTAEVNRIKFQGGINDQTYVPAGVMIDNTNNPNVATVTMNGTLSTANAGTRITWNIPTGTVYGDFFTVPTPNVAPNVVLTFFADRRDIPPDQNLGSVFVVDNGELRTLTGLAYMAGGFVGPVIATFAHIQLYNPVLGFGNDRNVFVKRIDWCIFNGPAGAAGLQLVTNTLALPVTLANWLNKAGGTSGNAILKADNNVAALGGLPMYSVVLNSALPAESGGPIVLEEPIQLIPGIGLIVRCTSPNVGLGVSMEGYEKPV